MASMGAPANMDYWLGRKYANLEKQTEGEYQRNTADAASIGPLREAQGFNLRATGQQALEGAATDAATRYMSPDWLRGAYRQLNEGALPPTIAPPGGAGAPGAGAPSVAAPPTPTTPPPIQFQTLPSQPAPTAPVTPPTIGPRSDAAPLTVAPFQTGAVAPQLQSPEQLTQAALSRRRQVASLTRPGFRRGTARVKPQGLKKGATDVSSDETFLGTSPDIIPGAPPPGMMAVAPPAAVSAAPGAMPYAAPGAMPGAAPGFVPSPTALPPSTPPIGPPSPLPMGPSSLPPAAGPAPSAASNTWPGGQPKGVDYNPNAMTGVENLGGIVDFTSRIVNPDRFNEWLATARLSENVEDRRGEVYNPNAPLTTLEGAGNFLGNIGNQILQGGQALSADIGKLILGDQAAPGSLAAQAGYNDIAGGAPTTVGSILSGFRNPFGSSSAAPAPAAPLPASSTVTAPAAPAPTPTPAPAPARSADDVAESQGLKKGSANVKGKGKASKADSPPQGLEALLPLLMAMQGGGGGGPPAGPPPARGFKKGSANVKSKGKASKAEGPSLGLEELLAALSAAGVGSAGPPAAGPPMPMAPGFAFGIENVQFTPPPVAPLMTFPSDNRYAQGTSSVPFGANYVSGAHTVPGQGTGKVDMIPAMLAPHEAVLNRAAADMLGRGLIAALNARGVKEMGMHRGATT